MASLTVDFITSQCHLKVAILMCIMYNYPPKGRCIVVEIYREVKRRDILYLVLFTNPEKCSCFSIHPICWIKMIKSNFL